MKHSLLPRQGQRTIHTPAIFDSGAPSAETCARTGMAGSTGLIEAVHVCGPTASESNADAPSRLESRS